jgi:hypothetical protein
MIAEEGRWGSYGCIDFNDSTVITRSVGQFSVS